MRALEPTSSMVPRHDAARQQGGASAAATAVGKDKHAMAFAGVYVFTLLLYLRPNELYPGIFGSLAIIKFIAAATMLAYVSSKMSNGERLTIWPVEVKMVLVITALGVILIPAAAAPQESIEMLNDTFSKVVLIFLLMVNLLATRERLFSIIKLALAGGVWIAWGAVKSYRAGDFAKEVGGLARIEGYGGGMFGNPNDLATALDLLLPLAVVMALISRGGKRYLYIGLAVVLGIGVMITFSRGGFLGMLALGAVLTWKLGHQQRIQTFGAALVVFVVFAMAMPGGYGMRMFTIFNPADDATGSAQIRREVLQRGALVALAHPLGVGVANFHMYSRAELKAHNSYIEISAELGILGLLAYLVLLYAPLRGLGRIERETRSATEAREKEIYYLSVGLQATLAAYYVCSFFSSIQYYWYLYYPVAYAVGLRTIWRREAEAGASEPARDEVARPSGKSTAKGPGGVLWQLRAPRRKVLGRRPAVYELAKGGKR